MEVLPRRITPRELECSEAVAAASVSRRGQRNHLSQCLLSVQCIFVALLCCWVLFSVFPPIFWLEPNGTAPRTCPKDFPCPRGTTRKTNITGVVCPSGTCTAQDCCVSIYTCICLGVCSAHSHKPAQASPVFVGIWNRLSFSCS